MKVACPATLLPGSKVLLIGESPGREECAEGRGFVGPAGRVLQRAASLAGLDWTSLSLSNVVKRPPDGGYSSDYFKRTFYETQETPIITKTGKVSKKVRRVTKETPELLAWYEVLRDEISQLRPNLVISVGSEATKALVGLTEIHKWRGSILESTLCPGRKVLPVVHPSYIQRGQWSDFWPLVYDLQKAKREMEFPEIRREPYQAVVIESPEELKYHIERIQDRWSLDIETRGGSIACIGLGYCDGYSQPTGLCCPLQTTRGNRWSLGKEQEIWRSLFNLFKSRPLLAGQNLPFDLDYLKGYGLRPSGILMDTMTAHCLLYPDWVQGYKGLDFITSFYLDDVCLAPNTVVLTAALEWVPISDVKQGDTLVGIDEYVAAIGHHRTLQPSVVENTWASKQRCWRVTLDNGRSFVASVDHPWLARKYKSGGQLHWIKTGDLTIGAEISAFGKPWTFDTTREAGWLAGFFDGEGTIGQRMVSAAQNPGLVLDQAKRYLMDRGYVYREYKKAEKPICHTIFTNMYDSLRFLGAVRPTRLLEKASRIWHGAGAHSHRRSRVKVVSMEYLGYQATVGIQTSTKTFIAEGLYTHNCYYKDEGKTWGSRTPDADLWQYNIKDVVHTLRASFKIEQQLRSKGLWEKYQAEILPLTWLALEMMERRLPVNESNHAVLDAVLSNEILEVTELLGRRVGYPVNTDSPRQVQDLLYNKIGLPARHKKGSGKVTVDENALRELQVYYDNPILDLIIRERHLRKRKGTFLDCELEEG